VARLDLLYAHIDDPKVPLGETVEAFAALVAEGTVGLTTEQRTRLDAAR